MPLAVCSTPIGNLEDVTLRVLRELAEAEPRALRGHAAHGEAPGAAWNPCAVAQLPRAQRGGADRRGAPPAASRRAHRPGERRGPSRRQRPRCTADRRRDRGRRPGDRVAGAFGGRDGARGERARRREVPVCRLPASRRARCAPSGRNWAPGRIQSWLSSRPVGFPPASPRLQRPIRRARWRSAGSSRSASRRSCGGQRPRLRSATEAPKGEITVVVGSAPTIEADDVQALEAVAELVAEGVGRRRAAEIVSRLTGVARNRLYRPSL